MSPERGTLDTCYHCRVPIYLCTVPYWSLTLSGRSVIAVSGVAVGFARQREPGGLRSLTADVPADLVVTKW